MQKALYILCFVVLFVACKDDIESKTKTTNIITTEEKPQKPTSEIKFLVPKVIREFPHDVNAYTQGLFYRDGFLYESTGQYGQSSLRKVDFQNGDIIKQIDIDGMYFSEGICYYDNNIYMLTWKSRKGFIFDFASFEKKGEFSYYTEGWGLESYKNNLVISDGSNYLRFIDNKEFKQKEAIRVQYHNSSMNYLNELELVDNTLYANIYMHDAIAMIDITNGEITNIIDCSQLRKRLDNIDRAEAFNGIAFVKETNTFILTGKNWDKYFEVAFVEK